MDVLPGRRAFLQLLAQLADEDVDRAIAVGHRVTPDPLVDRLALEHLAALLGEQVEQLELAAGEVEVDLAGESLEAVGPDLQIAGGERGDVAALTTAGAPAAARDRLDPRDRLLRMGRVWGPGVGPEPQPADPLGDGRAAGTDDERQIGEQRGDPV